MGVQQCSQGHRTNSGCRFYGFQVCAPVMGLPSIHCSVLSTGEADVKERVASAW